MEHKTQLERVRSKLERYGYVSRNECVRQVPAILRLSARIQDLEGEGYVSITEDIGRDYLYRLVSKPAPKTLAMRI